MKLWKRDIKILTTSIKPWFATDDCELCKGGGLTAQLLQSCLILWPYGLQGLVSSIHGILQARVLGWLAMLVSKGSSLSRNRYRTSCVSCIAGWFFNHWATWEAHERWQMKKTTCRPWSWLLAIYHWSGTWPWMGYFTNFLICKINMLIYTPECSDLKFKSTYKVIKLFGK